MRADGWGEYLIFQKLPEKNATFPVAFFSFASLHANH